VDPEHDGALCNLAHLLLARRHAKQIAGLQIAVQISAMQNTTLSPQGTAEHSPGDAEHNTTVPPSGDSAHVGAIGSTEHSPGTEERAERELRRVLRLALRANPDREDIAEAAKELHVSVDSDSEGEGVQGYT